MRVFGWQEGLHIEPETETERTALVQLYEALCTLGLGDFSSTHDATRPGVETHNEQEVVRIHEAK